MALLVVIQLAQVSGARASDFWDSVRDPARGAHEQQLRKAQAALASDAPRAALAHAQAAIARMPHLPAGYRLKGQALLALGQFGAASDAFAAALERDDSALDAPDSTRTAHAAGVAAMRSGNYALAARVQQRLAARLPPGEDRRRVFARLGDALMCMGPGQLERATWAYTHALSGAEPDDIDLYLGAALATLRSGRRQDAMVALSQLRSAVRLEHALHNRILPEAERLARLAVGLAAIGDQRGAAEAWTLAAEQGGPWHAFHVRSAAELSHLERP